MDTKSGEVWTLLCDSGGQTLMQQTEQSSQYELPKYEFNILDRFKQLRKEGKFLDVVFDINGSKFMAHKVILAAWSSYFASRLNPGIEAVHRDYVTVNFPDSSVFSLFLDFLYSGYVVSEEHVVLKLVYLAVSFNIESLKAHCEEVLSESLSCFSFTTRFFVSQKYGLSSLEKHCLQFLRANIVECVKDKGFLALNVAKLSNLMNKVVKADTPAEVVLSLIVSWMSHDLQSRQKYMTVLLKQVNWKLLSPCKFLTEISRTRNFFTEHRSCLYLLLHTLFTVGVSLEPLTDEFLRLQKQYMHLLSQQVDNIGNIWCDVFIPVRITHVPDETKVPTEDPVQGQLDTYQTEENILEVQVLEEHSDVDTNVVEAEWSPVDHDQTVPVESHQVNDTIAFQPEYVPLVQEGMDIEGHVSQLPSPFSQVPARAVHPLVQQSMTSKVAGITAAEGCFLQNRRSRNSLGTKCKLTVRRTGDSKVPNIPRRHKKTHSVVSEAGIHFRCDICQFQTALIREYSKHMKMHFPGPVFCCDQPACQYSTEQLRAFIHHRYVHQKYHPYGCVLCGNRYYTRGRLSEHYGFHKNPTRFECPVCRKKFKRSSNMKDHLNHHKTEKDFVCRHCNFRTKWASSFQKHVKIHTGNILKCDFPGCKFETAWTRVLKLHQETHSTEKKYSCLVCDKKFALRQYLKSHEKCHLAMEQKAFKCDKCTFATNRSYVLRNHVKKLHGENSKPRRDVEKNFICEICAKKFELLKYLRIHLKTHSLEKTHKCFWCEYSTPRRYRLKEHIAAHHCDRTFSEYLAARGKQEQETTKEKDKEGHISGRVNFGYMCGIPECSFVAENWMLLEKHWNDVHIEQHKHPCGQCDRVFVLKDFLTQHLQVHKTEERNKLHCRYCSYSTPREYMLKAHTKRHHKEISTEVVDQPAGEFECQVCMKKFMKASLLSIHMRYHLPNKPHTCPSCSASFVRKYRLREHIEKVHNRKESGEKKGSKWESEDELDYRIVECQKSGDGTETVNVCLGAVKKEPKEVKGPTRVDGENVVTVFQGTNVIGTQNLGAVSSKTGTKANSTGPKSNGTERTTFVLINTGETHESGKQILQLAPCTKADLPVKSSFSSPTNIKSVALEQFTSNVSKVRKTTPSDTSSKPVTSVHASVPIVQSSAAVHTLSVPATVITIPISSTTSITSSPSTKPVITSISALHSVSSVANELTTVTAPTPSLPSVITISPSATLPVSGTSTTPAIVVTEHPVSVTKPSSMSVTTTTTTSSKSIPAKSILTSSQITDPCVSVPVTSSPIKKLGEVRKPSSRFGGQTCNQIFPDRLISKVPILLKKSDGTTATLNVTIIEATDVQTSVVVPTVKQMGDAAKVNKNIPAATTVTSASTEKFSKKSTDIISGEATSATSIPPEDLKCKKCGKVLENVKFYLVHQRIHELEESSYHECKFCELRTKLKKDLAVHTAEKHKNLLGKRSGSTEKRVYNSEPGPKREETVSKRSKLDFEVVSGDKEKTLNPSAKFSNSEKPCIAEKSSINKTRSANLTKHAQEAVLAKSKDSSNENKSHVFHHQVCADDKYSSEKEVGSNDMELASSAQSRTTSRSKKQQGSLKGSVAVALSHDPAHNLIQTEQGRGDKHFDQQRIESLAVSSAGLPKKVVEPHDKCKNMEKEKKSSSIRYKCEICDEIFVNVGSFIDHKTIHKQIKEHESGVDKPVVVMPKVPKVQTEAGVKSQYHLRKGKTEKLLKIDAFKSSWY